MHLPALNADATASLDRARAIAAQRGLGRADLGDILVGVLDPAGILEASTRYGEVGMSRLDRVIAIGQGVEAEGVLVEMIALEIREAGAVLHWRTRAAHERIRARRNRRRPPTTQESLLAPPRADDARGPGVCSVHRCATGGGT